jgi:peptide/nickel transport system ATP-binding protein
MTEPLLSIAGLSAISDRDGGTPILRDVSLSLERGEVRGLVGESGAGKSTIAKALLGILPRTVRVTSGTIRFEGKDLLKLPAPDLREIMGSEISLIPQDPQTALNPGRRIEAQLTDGLRMRRGLSGRHAHARALKLLE